MVAEAWKLLMRKQQVIILTIKRMYNYLTGEMYASIFLTDGRVCGEDNIVTGKAFNTSNKTGMAKHKEQLKMLFFNPGKKIPGIPFIQ